MEVVRAPGPEEAPAELRPAAPVRPSNAEIAAWLILAAGTLLIFVEDLVPGVVAGVVFYLLLEWTSVTLRHRVSAGAVRPLALLLGTLLGGAAVTGAIMLLLTVIRAQMRNIPALMTQMAEILESTRLLIIRVGGYSIYPEAIQDAEDLKKFAAGWLKGNAEIIGIATETFSLGVIHIVMGLLLAMMVFLRHTRSQEHIANRGPLAKHLIQKVRRLTRAFTQVVTAQIYISAINTTLTALYLLVLLPLVDRKLPFSITIVFITFVCGLIPVLGNLISNTVIVIVSLGISTGTAIASLVFLVVIHKLEYVVNSKIIGSKTGADIWEILLAVIVGEAAFGIQGIILAPVIYTFAKRELKDWKVV
jgi:predicted PurR-regulated permease PerM